MARDGVQHVAVDVRVVGGLLNDGDQAALHDMLGDGALGGGLAHGLEEVVDGVANSETRVPVKGDLERAVEGRRQLQHDHAEDVVD